MRKVIAKFLIVSTLLWVGQPALILAENDATSTLDIAVSEAQLSVPDDVFEDVSGDLPINDGGEDMPGAEIEEDLGSLIGEPAGDDVGKIEEGAAGDEVLPDAGMSEENNGEINADLPNEPGDSDDSDDNNASSTTVIGDSAEAPADGAGGDNLGTGMPEEEKAVNDEELAATSTAEAILGVDDAATSTAEITEQVQAVDEVSVLAQWVTGPASEGAAAVSQIMPSGKPGVASNFNICGVVAGAGEVDKVYGQVFYPREAAFAPGDSRGRLGCGQVAAPVCEMTKVEPLAGMAMFCENEANSSGDSLITFDGAGVEAICGDEGGLARQTAAVYCCGAALAYDDISGNYDAGVIASKKNGEYSNMLAGQFEYAPLTLVEVNFGDLNYGAVKEEVGAVAQEFTAGQVKISEPVAVNAGNTRARIKVWQDDMGLGVNEAGYNIAYGARVSGQQGEWLVYEPFKWVFLPEVLDAGAGAGLEFSTTVLSYPQNSTSADYQGQMKIEAEFVEHYECLASAVGEPAPMPLPFNGKELEIVPAAVEPESFPDTTNADALIL